MSTALLGNKSGVFLFSPLYFAIAVVIRILQNRAGICCTLFVLIAGLPKDPMFYDKRHAEDDAEEDYLMHVLMQT